MIEMDTWATISILLILVFTFVIFLKKKALNIPGPRALPLLGNLHLLNNNKLHLQLLEWAKQHGPVYRLWIGYKPVVIITGSKQIREALVRKGKDFSGRPPSYILSTLFERNGVVFSDATHVWKIQKKLFLKSLKGYGTGLRRIENITSRYMNQWLDELKNTYDDSVGLPMRESLFDVIYHLINAIALREDLHTPVNISKTIENLKDTNSVMHECLQFKGLLLDTFPLLRFVMPSLRNAILRLRDNWISLFLELKNKELTLLTNEKNDGAVSNYTLLSNMIKYQLGDTEVHLNDADVIWAMQNIYGAGISTTNITLSFLFNILALNLDIQGKLQAEIDNVVGQELITLEHSEKMPYTKATLLENLRFTSVLPTLLPHRSTTNTCIDEYQIPQDTEVWINAWGLHHDESLWDNPFTFDPERFLDAAGKVVPAEHPNRFNLVAFGAGSRACLGETFAMSRMFLILSMFLQKYSVYPFSSAADQPTYDTREIELGISLEPPPYKLRLQARN